MRERDVKMCVMEYIGLTVVGAEMTDVGAILLGIVWIQGTNDIEEQ